jgi:hypothetical protein
MALHAGNRKMIRPLLPQNDNLYLQSVIALDAGARF